MKEEFYTPQNIDTKAVEFMRELQPLRKLRQHIILQPKKAALLVIDMQKFFFEKTSHAFIPSMPAIVPNLKNLQKKFLTVIQTKHGNTKANAKAMRRWWGDHLLTANDPKADIIQELVNPKIPVILKAQYDAFWETNLEEELKSQGIEQVIISGVMTHLCCETTARSAFVRGFDVFMAVDGTATYNQEFHLASLKNLAHGFAIPMLCQELENIINDN